MVLTLPCRFLRFLCPNEFLFRKITWHFGFFISEKGALLRVLWYRRLIFHRVVSNFNGLLWISNSNFVTPYPYITLIMVDSRRINGTQYLQFKGFFFCLYRPSGRNFSLLPRVLRRPINNFGPTIRFPFLNTSTLYFRLPSVDSLISDECRIGPLPRVKAIISARVRPFFLGFYVGNDHPLLPPIFRHFQLVPIYYVSDIGRVVTIFVPSSISVFVGGVFPALFLSPYTVQIRETRNYRRVGVQIESTTILFLQTIGDGINGRTFYRGLLLCRLPHRLRIFFRHRFVLRNGVGKVNGLYF